MKEIDKHDLNFRSPHVYKCSCGVVAYIFQDNEKIAEMPKEIKYLPCGHAACCKTPYFDCRICAIEAVNK